MVSSKFFSVDRAISNYLDSHDAFRCSLAVNTGRRGTWNSWCFWWRGDNYLIIRYQVCVNDLIDIEIRICCADTSDALEELRRHLCSRTFLNHWKVNNVTGQRPNTRARGLQHANDLQVHSSKTRYRRLCQCLLALLGSGDWEKALQPLKDSDVRGLGEKAMLALEEEDAEHL